MKEYLLKRVWELRSRYRCLMGLQYTKRESGKKSNTN